MWVPRILVLVLLQRVLGHTLSRYEPQESEVYELKQDKDGNTVQFVYPKSSVPKLREIIYYHIIERPYKDPPEETTVEVSPESETERVPTNTHGYQFLDSLLVDYDSATEASTNPPEETEYYYDEDGNLYQLPAADQNEETPAEYIETYEPVEEAAETTGEAVQPADTAEPEEKAAEEVTELKEETSDGQEEDEASLLSEDSTDLTETDTDLTAIESDLAETDDIAYAENTEDVAIEATEPMTEETTDKPQDEELAVDEIVKKLEARNQLYSSPEEMKERLLKIRSYLPHLHPMNSQFAPEVVSLNRRRRRRRSVQAKRNLRRRREILYIYPQGRSLSEPYDESEIPVAPTLSPMDTAGLPDFIRSEINPENDANAESDAETPETVPNDESGFVPPPNTYGVQLDNGNGYVWNTLYGSASSEPSITGEQEYTTPYPAAVEELPTELPSYGDIPEESLGEEEQVDTEDSPFEVPEESFAEPDERFHEVEEIPAGEITEELPGDDENVEESLTEEIEGETIKDGSKDDFAFEKETTESPQDALEQKLLEIFDSLRDLEKKRVPSLIHENIESRIHEYLEAEKTLLLETEEEEPVEQEKDEVAEGEQPEIADDSVDQEKDVFGNDDGDIALETESEGQLIVPEDHGTYGFRLIGGQGEVWNDFTGVRYHVGNDEPSSDDIDNLEPGFNDFNKPVDESILEPFDDVTDKQPESDKTTGDKINVANDVSAKKKVSPIIDKIGNIFNNFKNLAHNKSDNQVTTAVPDVSDPLDQSSPFLALLEDDMYRDWVREWTIEYTRFLSEYINDSVEAATAKKELALLNAEAPLEEDTGTARLYINDEELTKSPEVDTIINTISDKYLKRRRKHCKQSESNAAATAENVYGGSLNSGKIVNVFVFFTEEQGQKILDLIKPGTDDQDIDTEYVDNTDEEYKPDESELEEGVDDNDSNEPTNVDEIESEPSDASGIVDEQTLEPVYETTEQNTDDSETDNSPVEYPELTGEPEIVEEPAKPIPEEPEAEDNLAEVTEVVEEPVTEQETIEIGDEVTGIEIENITPAGIGEVTADPIENVTDEETVVISELPEEPVLEEEKRGDGESEVDEVVGEEPSDQELHESSVEVADPIEAGAVVSFENTEDKIIDAQPIEKDQVQDDELIEEENENVETVEGEEVQDAEPIEGGAVEYTEPKQEEEAVEDAEPIEEGEGVVENAEPIEEEEAVEEAEHIEEEVQDVEPLEEEVAVEDAEPVEEAAIEDVEPLEEEVAVEDAETTEEEVQDAETVEEKTIEDAEPVEEAAIEDVEPIEEEAIVENTEHVEEETIEDAEPIEEVAAVEDAEPIDEAAIADDKEETA